MAESKIKLLSFKELGLDAGQKMNLLPNPGDTSISFDAIYVGSLPGKSVIVGASDGKTLPRLNEGQKVVVRALLPGGVALFPTIVQHVIDDPKPLVFFEIPRDIKFKQVRGATRVNVVMPILASNCNNQASMSGLAGKIVDISITGARLEIFNKLGSVGDEIQIKGKFKVGKISRLLALKSVIRMHSQTAEGHIYGVEFCEGDEENLLVLLGFTFYEIAFGEPQAVK